MYDLAKLHSTLLVIFHSELYICFSILLILLENMLLISFGMDHKISKFNNKLSL